MERPTTEDGLHVAAEDELDYDASERDPEEIFLEELTWADADPDSDLESLRGAFVDAFNSRDLDEIQAIVSPDVEVPDRAGKDGFAALAEELESMWRSAPALLLTRAFLEGEPCAVAWLPDEESCWTRVALVCFAHEGDRLTMVSVPEDMDALERAEAEAPDGDELDEWSDWTEWETGEETHIRVRLTV